jgi:nucleotide-binding universal stress UspA family protein
MIHIRKILYPTDFSSFATPAYFHAVAMAEAHHASLTIAYVFQESGSDERSPSEERTYWRNQLESISPADSKIAVNHVLLEGDAATEIIRYTRDAGIDLIVMGTHGRTGAERLLVGSVTEKVMREAPCSVLAVKLPRNHTTTPTPDLSIPAERGKV